MESTPFKAIKQSKELEEELFFQLSAREELSERFSPRIRRALASQIASLIPLDATVNEVTSNLDNIKDHSEELTAVLIALGIAASELGVQGGAAQLDQISLAVEEATAASNAQPLVNQQTETAVRQINSTTRKGIAAALAILVADGIFSGRALRRSSARYASESRSDSISVTETTHDYNIGSAVAAREAGVQILEWYTMQDEFVCPICGPMEGETRPIDGPYTGANVTGATVNGPPAHPKCRCGEAYVIRSIRQ